MKKYTINHDTLIIKRYNQGQSIVYEMGNTFLINRLPSQIIKDNCKMCFSSYDSVIQYVTSISGYKYKIPVILNQLDVVMIPSCSPRNYSCSWINLDNISNIINSTDNCSIIEFINGRKVPINASYSVLINQVNKSSRIKLFYDKRK